MAKKTEELGSQPDSSSTRYGSKVKVIVAALAMAIALPLHQQSYERGQIYKNEFKIPFQIIANEYQLLDEELDQLLLAKAGIVEAIGMQTSDEANELYLELDELETAEQSLVQERETLEQLRIQTSKDYRTRVNKPVFSVFGVEVGKSFDGDVSDASKIKAS